MLNVKGSVFVIELEIKALDIYSTLNLEETNAAMWREDVWDFAGLDIWNDASGKKEWKKSSEVKDASEEMRASVDASLWFLSHYTVISVIFNIEDIEYTLCMLFYSIPLLLSRIHYVPYEPEWNMCCTTRGLHKKKYSIPHHQ